MHFGSTDAECDLRYINQNSVVVDVSGEKFRGTVHSVLRYKADVISRSNCYVHFQRAIDCQGT